MASTHKNGQANGWPKGYRVKNRYTTKAVVYDPKTGYMPLQKTALDPAMGDPTPHELFRDRRKK